MTREKRRRVRASDLVDQKGGAAFNVVLLLVAFSLVVLFKVLVADDDEKDWMEAVTGDPEHELPPSALDRETVGRIVAPDASAPGASPPAPDPSPAPDATATPPETDAARTP